MRDVLAARRYAEALFEIALTERVEVPCQEELDALASAIETSPEISRFFANPSVRVADKQALLRKLSAPSSAPALARALVLNLLGVLLEKNRFSILGDVSREYRAIAERARGEAVAEIRTAVQLDEASRRRITERLEKRQGLKIVARATVDPSLIGGAHVRIGHRVIDGSIRGLLSGLRAELKQANVI